VSYIYFLYKTGQQKAVKLTIICTSDTKKLYSFFLAINQKGAYLVIADRIKKQKGYNNPFLQ